MGSKEANGPDFLTPLTVQLLCQQWRTEDRNTMLGYKHEQAYRGFSNHIKKFASSQKHTSAYVEENQRHLSLRYGIIFVDIFRKRFVMFLRSKELFTALSFP